MEREREKERERERESSNYIHIYIHIYVVIIIIIIVVVVTPFSVSTQALAGGFCLEFGWQQVSYSLKDSSQYSFHPQRFSNLDGLPSSSYFQVLQFWYHSFGVCTKRNNYIRYNCHLYHVPHVFPLIHVPHVFRFPTKVDSLLILFVVVVVVVVVDIFLELII